MKTSKLLITSLLTAAAMGATAYATDLSGFSGTIYTWAGKTTSGSDLAFGYYYTTDTSGNFTAVTSGQSGAWSAVQGIIATDKASATTGQTCQNTLRFVAFDDSSFTGDYTAGSIKTPIYTFNPLTLGGIIVESGATGFSISASGTGGLRSFTLGNGDGTAAKSVFHESFTLTLNTGASGTTNTIRGTQTWTIDENKIFTITSGSNALNLTGATTIDGGGTAKLSGSNISFGDGASVTVSGGSTFALGGSVALASGATSASISVDAGSTLDLSAGSLTVAADVTAASGAVLALGTVNTSAVKATLSGTNTLSGVIFDIDSYVEGAQLLGGMAGQTFSVANLSIGGYLVNQRGSATFSVSDSGVLTLDSYAEGTNYSLTWDGGASGVWKIGGNGWTTTETSDEVTFQNGDSVTFGADTTHTATLDGLLKVGALTVSGATGFTGTGTVAVANANLTTSAVLTVNSGVTLAVTAFASSITQNSTVDYSNLSGTGTLSLGLRNDNGIGFNLENFEGTIRVERGTGVTAASRFQLNTSTLNANARIVVADGNDLVFNDDTNKNISNSVTFEGSGTIHVNGDNDLTSGSNVCTGTLSGNVVVVGTLTKNGDGTLTLSGTSDISALTITKGTMVYSAGTHTVGSISASGKTMTVNGGSLTISGSAASTIGTLAVNGASLTISGSAASTIGTLAVNGAAELGVTSNTTITTLSGSSSLTKQGTGTVFVTGSSANAFHGTLVVEGGVVMMGQNANGRSDSSLTDSAHGAKIFVKSGATFTTHMGGSSASTPNTFNGDFYIASGATLGNKDGYVKLAGNIVFGATDTEGNFDSNATVTYAQYWQKAVEFAGAISGAGTVTLQNATAENGTAYYKISGADNTFSGTYKLTGAANKLVKLQLTNETAAQNAKINLSTQYASMELGASAVRIAGLEGAESSSVVLLSGTAASTLTVNQAANTTFAGTIAANIALVKEGAGTLTLSGANSFDGGLEIKEGIVVSTRAFSLGAGTNVVKLSGGQLSINAGVTLAQANIEIALSSAYATTAAIIGADSTASLAANTTVTITDLDLTGIALVSEAALANSSYEFKILDTISAGTGLTFKLSEALENDWQISDYTNGVLTIAAIPEPSVFGLLAGLGALALAGTRRRRRKA